MRAFVLALLLGGAGCGGGKKCTVGVIGETASLTGACRVYAQCEDESVSVDCPNSEALCSCRGPDGGTFAAAGSHPMCGTDVGHEMLKLCGFEG